MKRPPPSSDDFAGASGSKKRRRLSVSEDDDSSRTPSNQNFRDAPPMHKIYNSACRKEKPDELFRKDLISAMKLPDNEQLDESEFWDVSDSWKQEWERGVQVPVNSTNVPNPNVRPIRDRNKNAFKLPKKFMRTTEDSFFSQEDHVLIDTAAKAENVCKYDMDDLDCEWLKAFNGRRYDLGLPAVVEEILERVLEDFETQCSNRFQDALKTEKGLGIEYDEDVICDVCKSPDCEEGNEMVFCDSCNICVHQACYGITAIPEGSWVCKPCALNVKPSCVLCPNAGGAMKNTSSGDKWAHVSCALWIPEVSIGCPEKMEPVTKVSNVPASRWALICSICRERNGACIQCSVKQCKVAYHVTCAFENGLEMEMKTTALDSSEEGVKMQSFCPKHCKSEGAEKSPPKPARKTTTTRRKKEVKNKDIVENEVDEHNARLQKIRSLEAQFHRYVSIKDTADLHHVDTEVVDFLYFYWVLKRRAKFNKPLLITKCDEANLLIKQHENLLYSRLKMFVHLRQDLERVRNLCYMVGRREKIFRIFIRIKEEIFDKQIEILTNKDIILSPKEREEVINASIGSTLFERFYSCDVEEEKEEEVKNASQVKPPNPYAKSYVNNVHTRSRRRTTSQNLSDPINENCDSESNEMPILVKCRSEENLSSTEANDVREPPTFINSGLIKLEPEDDFEDHSAGNGQERKSSADKKVKNSLPQENHNQFETNEPEMPKINSEILNTKTRKNSSANESSSDKNSLCLSDKENINALNKIKVKKTRGQAEGRHQELKNGIHDLSHPKLEIFDEESMPNEISNPDIKKNFKGDSKNARYPTRNRRCSIDLENEQATSKLPESVVTKVKLPSHKVDSLVSPTTAVANGLTFSSPDNSPEANSQGETPRRKRGRPRKTPCVEVPSEVSLTVIKQEVIDLDSDKNNSCDGLLSDARETPGFRMSLRHNREQSPVKRRRGRKPKNKRPIIKLEFPEATPFQKTANGECSRSSPEWDTEDARPATLSSPEQPSFERIVIRLRKDANGESWKNDSSSSESFRIVHNEMKVKSENSVSEFPSVIKYNNSLHNPGYSGQDDGEIRHRYSMRERAVAPRTVKSATEKS